MHLNNTYPLQVFWELRQGQSSWRKIEKLEPSEQAGCFSAQQLLVLAAQLAWQFSYTALFQSSPTCLIDCRTCIPIRKIPLSDIYIFFLYTKFSL